MLSITIIVDPDSWVDRRSASARRIRLGEEFEGAVGDDKVLPLADARKQAAGVDKDRGPTRRTHEIGPGMSWLRKKSSAPPVGGAEPRLNAPMGDEALRTPGRRVRAADQFLG